MRSASSSTSSSPARGRTRRRPAAEAGRRAGPRLAAPAARARRQRRSALPYPAPAPARRPRRRRAARDGGASRSRRSSGSAGELRRRPGRGVLDGRRVARPGAIEPATWCADSPPATRARSSPAPSTVGRGDDGAERGRVAGPGRRAGARAGRAPRRRSAAARQHRCSSWRCRRGDLLVPIPGANRGASTSSPMRHANCLERLAGDAGSNPTLAVDARARLWAARDRAGHPGHGEPRRPRGRPSPRSAAASRCFDPLSPDGRAARRGPRGTRAASGRTAASLLHRARPAGVAEAEAAARRWPPPSPPGSSPAGRADASALGLAADAPLPAGDRARRLTRSRTPTSGRLLELRAQRLAEAPARTSIAPLPWRWPNGCSSGYLEGQRRPARRPPAPRAPPVTCSRATSRRRPEPAPRRRRRDAAALKRAEGFALFHLGDLDGTAATAYRDCLSIRLVLADRRPCQRPDRAGDRGHARVAGPRLRGDRAGGRRPERRGRRGPGGVRSSDDAGVVAAAASPRARPASRPGCSSTTIARRPAAAWNTPLRELRGARRRRARSEPLDADRHADAPAASARAVRDRAARRIPVSPASRTV